MDDPFFHLYIVNNFFAAETCRELIAEMRSSAKAPAVTYGKGEGAVNQNVRRVNRVTLSDSTLGEVSRRLEQTREAIENHFDCKLAGFEEPQFLQYGVGDFFVAHQDGNTGMIRLETDDARRVSVSIFLNRQAEVPEPDTFSGGSLVFHDWRTHQRLEIPGETGMLVAFRSATTHEVTPVTAGERYSVVSWYCR